MEVDDWLTNMQIFLPLVKINLLQEFTQIYTLKRVSFLKISQISNFAYLRGENMCLVENYFV